MVEVLPKLANQLQEITLLSHSGILFDFVVIINLFILQGRIAFGNKLLETSLCFKFESVTGIYTTSQANSSLDEFMHILKCQGKNVRVMLSPSPAYNGPIDE